MVLDKLTYAGNPENLGEFEGQPGFRFIKGDICDRKLVDQLAAEVDGMVNFAAESHVDRSLEEPWSVHPDGCVGASSSSKPRRHAAHRALPAGQSTDEVYGDIDEGPVDRGDALRPRSPYSASKAGGEMMVWAYRASVRDRR